MCMSVFVCVCVCVCGCLYVYMCACFGYACCKSTDKVIIPTECANSIANTLSLRSVLGIVTVANFIWPLTFVVR